MRRERVNANAVRHERMNRMKAGIRPQDAECRTVRRGLKFGYLRKRSKGALMNPSASRTILGAKTANDPRWAAIVARDPTADDKFFYSVKTTGVYCRPSC